MTAQGGDAVAQRFEHGQRLAAQRRRERRRRQAQDRAGRRQLAQAAARLLPDQTGIGALARRGQRGEGQVARDAELKTRIGAVDPLLEALPGLDRLQGALLVAATLVAAIRLRG